MAQTASVRLNDGSTITIGPRSVITVRMSAERRHVELVRGEAFFAVAHDGRRPFEVTAGTAIVRDVGTKFDLSLSEASLRLSVESGAVLLRGSGSLRDAPHPVSMGQRAELRLVDGSSAGMIPIVSTSPAHTSGAWREGRLSYDGARLEDVVADINRYYAPGVAIASADLRDLRVTASFGVGEVPAFMEALNAGFPVRVGRTANGSFTVSSD